MVSCKHNRERPPVHTQLFRDNSYLFLASLSLNSASVEGDRWSLYWVPQQRLCYGDLSVLKFALSSSGGIAAEKPDVYTRRGSDSGGAGRMHRDAAAQACGACQVEAVT